MHQKSNESFHSFVNKVKHEAKNCQFSCEHQNCTVPNTLIHNQIIIGNSNDEIRKNALKNQWSLTDLAYHGCQLEAAALSAEKITADKHDNPNSYHIRHMKQPGRYCKKRRNSRQNDKEITHQSKTTNTECKTCSSKQCPGHKSCPAYHCECFDCHKKVHFQGAIVCTYSKKGNSTHRLESDSDSADTSDRESDSSDESTDNESASTQNDTTLRENVKLSKHVTKIRSVKQKEVRKISKQARYLVNIVLKENTIQAFADTGADMSIKSAQSIKLPLTRMKIKI